MTEHPDPEEQPRASPHDPEAEARAERLHAKAEALRSRRQAWIRGRRERAATEAGGDLEDNDPRTEGI